MMMTKITPGPFRILVVENDPVQRASLVDILQGLQYEVYAAEVPEGTRDAHQALLDDARHKAHSHRCHLAIVDMRLKDDNEPSDTSGLALVAALAPTVSIIRSGHGDRKTVRAALKSPPEPPQRAFDFVGKEDGPEALHIAIKDAVSTYWPRFVKENPIKWPYSIPGSSYLIHRFFPDSIEVPAEELEDLLWVLYPDAEQLSVEALEGGDSSPSTGLRPRSIVVRVRVDDKTQRDIVKLARADRSIDEFRKYRDHVYKNFPRSYYAKLESVKTLWDVRGARYEHVGNWGRMTLFRIYYRSRCAEEICNVLKVFGKDWEEHYATTRHFDVKNQTLYQIFRKLWGENWHKRLSEYTNPLSGVSPGFQVWLKKTLELADPFNWLRKRINMNGINNTDDESPGNVPMAILHGDLQGDNCFVDEEHGNLWLIDFERSGPAPIVADWVELEIDILTRLCCFSHQHRREFLELAARVMSPDANAFWHPAALVTRYPEAIKALTVIQEIRAQAKLTTGLVSYELNPCTKSKNLRSLPVRAPTLG